MTNTEEADQVLESMVDYLNRMRAAVNYLSPEQCEILCSCLRLVADDVALRGKLPADIMERFIWDN